MKLKNKKTGEIVDVTMLYNEEKDDKQLALQTPTTFIPIDNLAELNAEWEDYEDELLYVISAEHKGGYQCVLKEEHPEICKAAKELGIGFETEKGCQKAVEKLKAWKRLRDKGFKFGNWYYAVEGNRENDAVPLKIKAECKKDNSIDNLDLLFGGEE